MWQFNKNKEKKVKIRPSRIIFLIVLIASNTFAWFIYATRIETNVSVHVKSWNVIFEAGEDEVTDTVSLVVDSIYPGMEDFSYAINAYNRSEVSATLSYVVLEARILDEEYVTVEQKTALGETVLATDLTSAQLQAKLLSDYPFSIAISTSSSTMANSVGEATYNFDVTWPYENNQDDVDTEWGIAAYDFKESNPDDASITLKVKIIITQNASS